MFRDHIPGDDKETRINTNDASIMLVCINGYQENRPYGVIVNYCLPVPIHFAGIHELVLGVDEVCELSLIHIFPGRIRLRPWLPATCRCFTRWEPPR